MRIYVGNLSYRSSEQDVHKAFTAFGEVARTQLAIDPLTGRSAGFAYVEMPNDEEAQAAIDRLNGKEINARVVSVTQAVVEEPAVRPDRFSSERGSPGRSAPRPGRFFRDGDDSRRASSRHSPGSLRGRPANARRAQAPRGAGRDASGDGSRGNSGGRGHSDRREAGSSSPRGNPFRGDRPRSDQTRSDRPRGDQALSDGARSDQSSPSGRAASVWEQRRRVEPRTPRGESEARSRELPSDQASSGTSSAERPDTSPNAPAAANPWTRRRPKPT